MSFRTEGLVVATLEDGSRVALTPVVVGRDFGNTVEIVSGLTGDERIIVNPPDSINAGDTVRPVAAGAR